MAWNDRRRCGIRDNVLTGAARLVAYLFWHEGCAAMAIRDIYYNSSNTEYVVLYEHFCTFCMYSMTVASASVSYRRTRYVITAPWSSIVLLRLCRVVELQYHDVVDGLLTVPPAKDEERIPNGDARVAIPKPIRNTEAMGRTRFVSSDNRFPSGHPTKSVHGASWPLYSLYVSLGPTYFGQIFVRLVLLILSMVNKMNQSVPSLPFL